ncbi:MAG: glycosyltransferase family 2 protein [Pseudomonadota bacterium]
MSGSIPLVSVLLPTFNSARYLTEAVNSILHQTFSDLELIILDGGSSDGTIEIAQILVKFDKRIRVEIFPSMRPAARSDQVLPTLRSKYVAVQHSDDISYAHRIARQVQAFADDPSLGVCSSIYRSFWHDRTRAPIHSGEWVHAKPERHEEIKANLLFWWVMHCPTLMFDREKAADAGLRFTNEFRFGDDYWQTVLNINKLKFYNVQEELSAYRLHFEGDGAQNKLALHEEERKLKQHILGYFGFEYTPRELEIHVACKIFPDDIVGAESKEDFRELFAWLEKLRAQNMDIRAFDTAIFNSLLDTIKKRVTLIKRKKLLWKPFVD